MITNKSITIYNRLYDSESRLDKWKHTFIGAVSFYADNKVTLDSDGISSADVFKIRIPGETPGYVEPDKYTGADGTWTLQKDDYIVLGKGEAIEKPKDLEAGAIRINSFSDNRRGNLPHFRVGGQ